MTSNTGSTGGATGTLTDGTGVSKLLASKVVKDLVLDFALSLPGVFIVLGITNLEQALAAPIAVGLGVGDALVRWAFRAIVRWAQSDSVA